MGTYTGTDEDDSIAPSGLSDGVLAAPPGTAPGAGPDTLIGNGGDDRLVGGGGRDQLFGGEGDDRLIGRRGADILDGGSGDDFYYIDDLGDVVSEVRGDAPGGVDRVRASVSYTLGFGLEALAFSGRNFQENLDGTGNALANVLSGNLGDNVLRGLRGGDWLHGSWGSDELIGGSGNDRLYGGKQEDLLKGGGGDDWLNGGRGTTVDRLGGGEGDDELIGEEGADRLAGGQGDDFFVFRRLDRESSDTIVDFGGTAGNNDRIVIRAHGPGFGIGLKAGTLSGAQFQVGAGHEAQTAEVRFLFDTQETTLWFDRNGNKDGGLTQLANLQAAANLQIDDILLI